MRATLALAAVAAAAAQSTFWWRYPNMDAENEDIKQLPCGHSCTIAELEAACAALPACVAFNSHGYLKSSIADMVRSSCSSRARAPAHVRRRGGGEAPTGSAHGRDTAGARGESTRHTAL